MHTCTMDQALFYRRDLYTLEWPTPRKEDVRLRRAVNIAQGRPAPEKTLGVVRTQYEKLTERQKD